MSKQENMVQDNQSKGWKQRPQQTQPKTLQVNTIAAMGTSPQGFSNRCEQAQKVATATIWSAEQEEMSEMKMNRTPWDPITNLSIMQSPNNREQGARGI